MKPSAFNMPFNPPLMPPFASIALIAAGNSGKLNGCDTGGAPGFVFNAGCQC